MKHYVYRLDDPITKEFYFGSRSCKCLPKEDIKYKGSMKTWKPEDKSRLIKTILKSNFRKRETSIRYEIKLIKENINNELNRNYHTPSEGYHTHGTFLAKDENGKHIRIDINDERFVNGDLVGLNKNKKASKETREKLSISHKGNTHSDETRNKMSKYHSGKVISAETRKKIGNAHRGRTHTFERIEKNRISHLGKTHSKETRKKISIGNMGKICTNEVKQLLSVRNSEYTYEKYDKDGNFVNTFDGMYDALLSIQKLQRSNCIYNNCLGYTTTAGGFIWKRMKKIEK